MVALAGGYCGKEFQGFWGVTQGDPLSPNILNVVVDAVVRNWAMVMVKRSGGQSGVDGRYNIKYTSSTWMMTCYCHQTWYVYRRLSAPC